MQRMSINGLTLFFDAEDQDAAELISRACKKSTGLLQGCLGLDTPKKLSSLCDDFMA